MKLEFYDYATSTRRAETCSHRDDARVRPLPDKLLNHCVPTQMPAPLPDYALAEARSAAAFRVLGDAGPERGSGSLRTYASSL